MTKRMLVLTTAITLVGGPATGCAQAPPAPREPLPSCEWCGTGEAPAGLTSTMIIPSTDESGERLVIEGIVYSADGRTPAAGVLIYAYHTDAQGVYIKRGNETGNARRHGYLRGWLRTGQDGRYRIETIRPGTYPSRNEPAHVHFTLQERGEPERYIDDVVFEGDPLLTQEHHARLVGRGGSGIVRLGQDAEGRLRAVRDIYLGRR